MAKKMKGQFFLIAIIIIIGMTLSLIKAFVPVEKYTGGLFSEEHSLAREIELAVVNNITPGDLIEFARQNGVKSVAAVSGNGEITVYNGYGGTAQAVVRDSSGEVSLSFSRNATIPATGEATVSIWVGRDVFVFRLNASRTGVASAVSAINGKGFVKSIYSSSQN